jgi:cupin domain
LRLRVGAEEVEMAAGGAQLVPRGTPHAFWNPRPEPARYVLIMTPRIAALIDALHASTSQRPEAVAAIFRAHRSEFLGWP